jgi:hypothetical protein
MDDVREDVDIGFVVGNEFPVEPNIGLHDRCAGEGRE